MTDVPLKPQPVKALTANLLVEGDVVFWGKGAWREQFAGADLMTDMAVADTVLDAAKAMPTVTVDPYLIDVRIEEDGCPVPISFRERVRALGPTIHPEMGKQADGGPVIEAIQHAHGAARSTGRVALIRRKVGPACTATTPYDAETLADRADEFRGQVARRLSGEITEDQFKPLRLMNGLYLQLHAYMLRVAIPYGVLSSDQVRGLAAVARKYDKGYGHFTTRQNIQFHWIKLRDAPDILDDLAAVGLHAIQTSGNCIRNTTSDPHAGATAEEVEDPRIWCEAIRQWSTFHPEFSFLPRKFKIAVSATPQDRTASRVHDIGLQIKRSRPTSEGEGGKLGFEVMVGGGLGRTPYLGSTIREFLPAEQLLGYLSAILRVYNRYGRRDNIYKARIKILVASLGAPEFARQVEAEWTSMRDTGEAAGVDVPEAEIDRIRASFGELAFETLPAVSQTFEAARAADPGLARFVRNNLSVHKVPGYAIVNVSLKAPGEVPGDCSAAQMDGLADLAQTWSFDEIRVTHEQNLVLPHVPLHALPEVYARLQEIGLASANIALTSDIIACPGLDYCALANARSINIAQDIATRFAELDRAENVGEMKIKISGCINACGHHHIAHIGILGVDKKGEEFYQLSLGGSGAEDARLGDILGPAIAAPKVTDAVETLIETYLRERQDGERFLDTYRRVGVAPFKAAVYVDAH